MWKYTIRQGATFEDGSIKFPLIVKERNRKLDAHVRPGGVIQVESLSGEVEKGALVKVSVPNKKEESQKEKGSISVFAEVTPPAKTEEVKDDTKTPAVKTDDNELKKSRGGRFGRKNK